MVQRQRSTTEAEDLAAGEKKNLQGLQRISLLKHTLPIHQPRQEI